MIRIRDCSFPIGDLPHIRDVFGVAFRALEEHGAPFVAPLCELMALFAKPYIRAKAHQEYAESVALCDIIRVLAAVLLWDVPEIQLTAAKSLLAFVQAAGFDQASGVADEKQSCWSFHQQLLREADALPELIRGLRNQVTAYLDDAAFSRTKAVDLLVSTARAGATGGISKHRHDNQRDDDDDEQRLAETGNLLMANATRAVRAVAITRSPELLNVLARVLRECSESEENALVLTRSGVPQLCINILSRVDSIRDELAHVSLETLWNLLELSQERASAAGNGSYGDASLSLSELLDKHRSSNAIKMLGNPMDVLVLSTLLETALVQGSSATDKEFRNDCVVVASLVASKPDNTPFFASTGYLQLLLDASTSAEMYAQVGLPLDNFGTVTQIDFEFKQLAWSLITSLCQGPFSDFEVHPVTAPSSSATGNGGGDEHATCLTVVRDSLFIPTLLLYLDPLASSSHPYLAAWSPPARRALEVQAMQTLSTLSGTFAKQIVECGGLGIIASYIRNHSEILNGARASDGSSASPRTGTANVTATTAGASDGDDSAMMSTAKHQPAAARPPAARGAGRMLVPGAKPHLSLTAAPTSAVMRLQSKTQVPGSAASQQRAERGEDDAGRQYWALRVLHALCDVEARPDPEAHLSSLLTAGVPTVVASSTRKVDPIALVAGGNSASNAKHRGAGDGAARGVVGHEIAATLGEIGVIEDLVLMLKAREADRSTSPLSSPGAARGAAATGTGIGAAHGGSSSLSPTARFAGTATIAANRGIHVNLSGHGQGIVEVTPAAATVEGRKHIEPGLLTEELLLLLTALTRGAADAAASKAAQSLSEIRSLCADDVTQGLADAHHLRHDGNDNEATEADGDDDVVEPQRNGRGQLHSGNQGGASQASSGDGPSPPTHVTSTASTDAVRVSLTARLRDNQDRLRKCGGVSCLIRYLKVCMMDARQRTGGEFSTSGVRPRVATATVSALRSAAVGNVRSEARVLADGGIDALLDLAEVAPPTLRPIALTALADLSRNPISHVCVRCWRSDLDGVSAGVVLLRMWADEEKRLGVVHERHTAAIDNLTRPLDGGDAKARQAAIFSATHTPTAAAVKDIVPGGRQAIASGVHGNTSRGRRGSVQGETSAFRGLRRALRAAKLWQQVESATPGGPLAALVAQTDLRHKIFGCLHAVGFNEVQTQIDAMHNNGAASEGKATDGDDTIDQSLDNSGISSQQYQTVDTVTGSSFGARSGNAAQQLQPSKQASGSAAEQAFPDLTPQQRISLELARSYPDLVVGSAWDDVRTRLAEMRVQPIDSDSNTLEHQLESVRTSSDQVRQAQLVHSRAAELDVVEREHSFLSQVLDRRAAEQASLKFNEKNKRKPWATSGKTYVGLSMDERKGALAARTSMLSRSYIGFQPPAGMPQPTSDGEIDEATAAMVQQQRSSNQFDSTGYESEEGKVE